MSSEGEVTDDTQLFGDEHVRVYQETDGERGYLWRRGSKIVLVTTKRRSNGEPSTAPLIHRVEDGAYVVIASKGGSPDHPAWFKNLQADPDVVVQDRAERIPVTPRIAEGEERARLWRLMNEDWPDYDRYQEKTDRQIPVVVLEPR